MTDINSITIIGRITRDCGADERSFGYLQNGTARANVSIAVNRSKKQADGSWTDEASFFDVVIWGKTAENLKPYLTKGTQIAIDGHLHQERWEKDGQKYSKVSIVADSVQLCGGKRDNSQNGNPQQDMYQQPQGYTQQQYPQSVPPNAQPYQQPVTTQGITRPNTTMPPQEYAQQGGFKEDIPWDSDIPF